VSYVLALGPFEATWRGPQRLTITAGGERVVESTYRSGYNERGCEARLPRLRLDQALQLVARICGTCSHAHSMAFCQALEALAGAEAPERAAALRCVAAELERLASHLGTLRLLMQTLGLQVHEQAFEEQQGQIRQGMQLLAGTPALPDLCVPGGVQRDLPEEQRGELLVLIQKLNRRLYRSIDALIDRRAILECTADVGALARSAAEAFGVRGPLARSTGIPNDERLDRPYAFYGRLDRHLIVQEGGDVYARLVVLLLDAFESVKLVEQALTDLPAGVLQGEFPDRLPSGEAGSAVEAPRGLLRYQIQSDGARLTAVQIDAPRQLDRLLARALLVGALVDDVPLIIQSLDVCTACAER
jgi:Ni,Fe-hydrogenase III large subunit